MDITFKCDKCGQGLVVDEAGAGMTVNCPKCGKEVYVASETEERELVKGRRASQGSPHAERAAQLMHELDGDEDLAQALDVRRRVLADKAALEKYVEEPNRRVVIKDADVPFWSVFVIVFKVWVSCLILFIVTYPILFFLMFKFGPRIAAFFVDHARNLQP